jgi:hypothetical protein
VSSVSEMSKWSNIEIINLGYRMEPSSKHGWAVNEYAGMPLIPPLRAIILM